MEDRPCAFVLPYTVSGPESLILMGVGQNTLGPIALSKAGVKVVQTSSPTSKQIAMIGPV